MKSLKIITCALFCLLFNHSVFSADSVYENYKRLLGQLGNTEAVVAFIDEHNYLSDRLKKKWLSYLAKEKNHALIIAHFKPSGKSIQQCQYLLAQYHTGHTDKAMKAVEPLWLSGKSMPGDCNELFSLWQDSKYFSNELIWARFELAIEKKNYGLARHLTRLMRDEDKRVANQWVLISRAPHRIKKIHLTEHPQNTAMLTHGIRKLVKGNIDNAIKNWRHMEKSHEFSHAQKQKILRTIALYAAMRNRTDATEWFNKLDPKLMPTMHHEWRVRAALKSKDFTNAKIAIEALPTELKEKSCWQYWHARSLEALGHNYQAKSIYKRLSQKRHYYGFLASHRANITPKMEDHDYKEDRGMLKKYQQQIDYINALYEKGQRHQANLLSYELANSLNDRELVQLAETYSNWNWHEKALSIANQSKHKNHLRIRFPLAHKTLVMKHAKKYDVEPTLIYAVIRQESTFRQKAKSSANAMGLMQVIPSTARRVAKKNQIELKRLNHMYQPKINVEVGTAYLKHLSKRFDDHPVLMAAAYNAGPRQVNHWLRKHPRNEPDIWIETLPWGETRNYLKNIVAFYAVYQYRLDKEPSIERFMKPF